MKEMVLLEALGLVGRELRTVVGKEAAGSALADVRLVETGLHQFHCSNYYTSFYLAFI
jgi:hypothetical protein